MITADPAAVVTRYIHAVRDGDRGAIRDSFAENATWDYPGDLPLSGIWRGRDTIVDDFLGSVGTALEPGSRGGAGSHQRPQRRRPGHRRVDLPRHRPGRLHPHDPEGFSTASRTRSFTIIEINFEIALLP
jgi:hypothetical protein